MAKRINRPLHSDQDKNKIKASQLLNLLARNALGELKEELSQGRIRSIEVFCKKYLPDLAATQMDVTTHDAVHVYAEVPEQSETTEQWVKQLKH